MRLIIGLLRLYQIVISPAIQLGFGIHCRYEESCSRYMERAIREKGLMKGSVKGFKRILSCNALFGSVASRDRLES